MSVKKPNILFILTDQQRKDTLSSYGGDVCQTPNIDQLAEDSVIFDNAYASCPVCTPARATLQTGLYPHHHGMETNNYGPGCMVHELPDQPQLLSRQLQNQNYSLGYTGKWHLGTGEKIIDQPSYRRYYQQVKFHELTQGILSLPTTLGYEGDDFPGHGGAGLQFPQYKQYLEENGLEFETKNKISGHYHMHSSQEVTSPIESTVDHYLTERAMHYMDTFKDRDQPFYFQLNFWGPHEPYLAPTKFLDMYRNVDIDPWPNFYDDGKNKPGLHETKRANSTNWETFIPHIKHYYAYMSAIDWQIGRLITYLKQNNLYDDTIIIFSSDHGESLGIHGGLCDKAMFMYDETTNIPLIVKPAKSDGNGRREERFVGTCDIYSTILNYAGVPEDEAARDGRSFVPLMNNEDVAWPDHVVTEGGGIESVMVTQRMIRRGNIKYVFNGGGDIDELYDLKNDPYEITNQINNEDYAGVLLSMRELLGEWLEEHNDGLLRQYKLLRLRENSATTK